jgi:hypothetical protein
MCFVTVRIAWRHTPLAWSTSLLPMPVARNVQRGCSHTTWRRQHQAACGGRRHWRPQLATPGHDAGPAARLGAGAVVRPGRRRWRSGTQCCKGAASSRRHKERGRRRQLRGRLASLSKYTTAAGGKPAPLLICLTDLVSGEICDVSSSWQVMGDTTTHACCTKATAATRAMVQRCRSTPWHHCAAATTIPFLPQLRPLLRERQGGGWALAAAAAALDSTALPPICFHLPEAALRR